MYKDCNKDCISPISLIVPCQHASSLNGVYILGADEACCRYNCLPRPKKVSTWCFFLHSCTGEWTLTWLDRNNVSCPSPHFPGPSLPLPLPLRILAGPSLIHPLCGLLPFGWTASLFSLQFSKGSGSPLPQSEEWLGYCYFHLGNTRKAYAIYNGLAIRNAEFWTHVACCAFLLGMYKEADEAGQKGAYPKISCSIDILLGFAMRGWHDISRASTAGRSCALSVQTSLFHPFWTATHFPSLDNLILIFQSFVVVVVVIRPFDNIVLGVDQSIGRLQIVGEPHAKR